MANLIKQAFEQSLNEQSLKNITQFAINELIKSLPQVGFINIQYGYNWKKEE